MPVIDIILAVFIVFGIVRGLFRGLFAEIAAVLALVLGTYGAIHFSNYLATYLSAQFDWNQATINISSFVITFVIIVVLVSLAGKALTKLASLVFLGALNRLLGGIFGGIKIALILSVILMVIDKTQFSKSVISDNDKSNSVLYEPVRSIAPMIAPNFLDKDHHQFIQSEDPSINTSPNKTESK